MIHSLRRLRAFHLLLLALLVLSASVGTEGAVARRGRQRETRPNVLIILTDDQRLGGGSTEVMAETKKRIGGRGITFTHAFASNPVCCPARATIMSGKYAHNHGVIDNFSASELNVEKTMQAALGEAGYHTSIFGKYLNTWIESPPVFDRWFTFRQPNPGKHKNLEYNDQGTIRAIPGYATDVLRRASIAQLKVNEKRDRKPWLMMITPSAPHAPYEPAARHRDEPVEPWPGNPAVTELDRTDKPQWVQDRSADPDHIQKTRAKQIRMLMAVDEMVAAIDKNLKRLDERRNTLVIFLSDNGYSWGDHGLIGPGYSKNHPYTSSIKIPFMMRWPKEVSHGKTSRRLITNVDLAATVYDATNVKPPVRLDGRSLLRTNWQRRLVFLEHWVNGAVLIPTWVSVRTKDYQYIESYDDQGEVSFEEYYDLNADPWQLENLLRDLNPLNDPDVSQDHDLVTRLSTCRGTSGVNPCP